jgi:hypothetical protein
MCELAELQLDWVLLSMRNLLSSPELVDTKLQQLPVALGVMVQRELDWLD